MVQRGKIAGDQGLVGEFGIAVGFLCIQEVQQRRAPARVSERHRLAHIGGLLDVVVAVRHDQLLHAEDGGVSRIHVAQDADLHGQAAALGARHLDFRLLLLALVAVENAQRDAHAESEGVELLLALILEVQRRVGRAVGPGELVVALGLGDRRGSGLQIRPCRQRRPPRIVERHVQRAVREFAAHVETVHRLPLVHQGQQSDLGGAQIHLGVHRVALELGALQFEACHVHPSDVAGPVTLAVHLQDFVVVDQVLAGQLDPRLGLQRAHERVPQAEKKLPQHVLLIASGDGGRVARAFYPQSAFMPPLDQLGDALRQLRPSVVRAELVVDGRELGIRPQPGRHFVGARLVGEQFSRKQTGIVLLKTVSNLFPGQRPLRP